MDIYIPFIAVGPYVGKGAALGIPWTAHYPVDFGCVGINGISAPINDVEARVTTKGRQMIAQTMVDGTAFKVTHMNVGTGGYEVANPIMTRPVNPEALWLENEIHRKEIDLVESPNLGSSRSYVGRFAAGSFTGGVGEIGLVASILYHPSDTTLEGEEFLFAVAHQGLKTMTLHDYVTYRIFVTI